ncbi:MAG: WecB/TagA/CpsF family glycosyltransferase [Balneolales bacterium]
MKKSDILGVKVSKYNLEETTSYLAHSIDSGQKKRVCVTPVNCILWAKNSDALKQIYNSADLVAADGMPLIWASRILSRPVNGRVTGLDLLPEFSKIAAKKKYTFFFLGASEGVASRLASKVMMENPGLEVTGTYSPPFAEKFTGEENQKIVDMINAVSPNVLWVSLTAPKQDYWIYEHFNKLNVNIAIGIGAAFDVGVGDMKRAPLWMQKLGMEWLYRLYQEPKRLYRRYLIEAPVFMPMVLKQVLKEKISKQKN